MAALLAVQSVYPVLQAVSPLAAAVGASLVVVLLGPLVAAFLGVYAVAFYREIRTTSVES